MSNIEYVETRDAPMAHHRAGLSWTRSGYGSKIPTATQVYYAGRWRRVYTTIWSNGGTSWIVVAKQRHVVCGGADGIRAVALMPWMADGAPTKATP